MPFLEVVVAGGKIYFSEEITQSDVTASFEGEEDAPLDKLGLALSKSSVEARKIASLYAGYEGSENALKLWCFCKKAACWDLVLCDEAAGDEVGKN